MTDSPTFTTKITLTGTAPLFDAVTSGTDPVTVQMRRSSRYDRIVSSSSGFGVDYDYSGSSPKSLLFDGTALKINGNPAWNAQTTGVVEAQHLTTDPVKKFAIRRYLRKNVPDLYDWGVTPSSADISSAWAQALLDLRTVHGIYELYVPPGVWNVQNQLADIDGPFDVYGDDDSKSVLAIKHTGHGVRATGRYGTGGSLRRLSIFQAVSGMNSSVGVYLYADARGFAPDFFVVEELNITGTGTFSYPMIWDGNERGPVRASATLSANAASNTLTVAGTPFTAGQFAPVDAGSMAVRITSGASAGSIRKITANTANTITVDPAGTGPFSPLAGDTFVVQSYLFGIRDVVGQKIYLFQSSFRSFEARHALACRIWGMDAFGANNTIYVTGPSQTLRSDGVFLDAVNVGATILDNSRTVRISGNAGTTTIASSVDYARIDTTNPGAVTNSSATSTVN